MVQVITCLCLLALTPLASAERFNTFYHTDHLGNVMGTSDDDGVYTPIVGNNYKSYGDSGGYSRPDPSDPAYTGKKFDPHTGLYYFGGRYYDPDAKRFISPDPMAYSPANPISFNRYAYANNNPLRYIDPDGANAVTAFGGLIYESAQFVSGYGFNGSNVLGSLADGYNGEGSGLARAAIDDALTFFPLGAVAGAAVKFGRMVKAARVAKSVAPAKRASNQTVLGHYPDYVKVSDKIGARRFEIPETAWNKMSPAEQWGANKKFLERMISKGDEVILGTPAGQSRSGSYYARELDYLKSQGYRLNSDGTKMLPGG